MMRHLEKINRNTKIEIKTDISFIDAILNHIEERDYQAAKQCLGDWKDELNGLLKLYKKD